jgi:hypothetical protein
MIADTNTTHDDNECARRMHQMCWANASAESAQGLIDAGFELKSSYNLLFDGSEDSV